MVDQRLPEPAPLVVTDPEGTVLDVVLMNTKGFKKSTEQAHLWVVDAQSGRVLPYQGNTSFRELRKRPGWYQAVIDAPAANGGASAAGDNASAATTERAGSQPSAGSAKEGGGGERVLGRLEALVKERKRTLPEGSYTSYLFQEGVDKIRKKTGEEAVELLLAREDGEFVSESADFLYHLIVLFVALDIPVELLLSELEKRLSH